MISISKKVVSSPLETIQGIVENSTPEEILTAIPALVDVGGETDFQLGGLLGRVKGEKLHGDQKFVEWLGSQGIKPARGYALARLYNDVTRCELSANVVETIGWSKLRIISSQLEPGKSQKAHNSKWIDEAAASTRAELNQKVRKAKGKPAIFKPPSIASLKTMMKKFEPNVVLEIFGEIWPDFGIKKAA